MEVLALTEEQIEENKSRFCELVRSVQRNGCKIEEFISYLESAGFFTTAASTKYHGCTSGGLCQHSLTVYDNLKLINASKNLNLDEDSMLICALLHDVSKVYMYKLDVVNKKIYYDGAPKRDACGTFEWVSMFAWKTTDIDDRPFVYGNHEETSEYIIRSYFPISAAESSAIINHHAGMGYDSAQKTPMQILGVNTLAAALHIADGLAAWVDKL